jgi:hypothetical protein
MTHPRSTLTLSRLEQVLDAYGGESALWPEQERASLLALIEQDAQARKLHAAALALDAKLDLSDLSQAVTAQLRARVLEIPIKHARVAPSRTPRMGLFALFALVPCVLGFVTGNFWLEGSDPDDDAWGELAEVASLSMDTDLFDEESP